MNRRYTPDELRSKLSQYANAHVAHIACSEDYIYIRFKEGYGSTYGESFSQELYVTTIKEMKEACKKSNLITLADWDVSQAIDEITESFIEEKELEKAIYEETKKPLEDFLTNLEWSEEEKAQYQAIGEAVKALDTLRKKEKEEKNLESAIAEHQKEFEDTHPDLLYMKEKYNELSKEARDKIECYSFETSADSRPANQRKFMYVEFKEGWLNTYRSDIYEEPQRVLFLSFEELEQGKLIEATQAKYFKKVHKWSDAVLLGSYTAEDYRHMNAVYEDPNETVLMATILHRVEELSQTIRVRSHG